MNKELAPIDTNIRNIAEAKKQIIDPVRQLLTQEIDWSPYTQSDPKIIGDYFDITHLMLLRNAPFDLPLTFLMQGHSEADDLYITNLPPTHLYSDVPNYYLAQIKRIIPASHATLLRDYILLMSLEMIIEAKGIEWTRKPEEVVAGLVQSHPAILEAGKNYSREFTDSPRQIFPRKTNASPMDQEE
jgi:hypothetical protein